VAELTSDFDDYDIGLDSDESADDDSSPAMG